MVPRDELGETQILAALFGIAEMVGNLTDTEEILEAIVRIAPGLVRVDRCALLSYDDATREFHTLVSFGPGGRPSPFEGLVLREGDMPKVAQRLVRQRLPVLMKDAVKEGAVPAAVVARLGLRSALIAPLSCRGRLLGAIWLDSTTGSHYFTSKEINVVLGIATQAAIALDNGRNADMLDLERRRFEALAKSLSDGMITMDRDLRILDLDAGAAALLGWTASEIRGRRFAEVFDLSEGEAVPGGKEDASGPILARKELRLRAHDGVRIPCAVATAVVRDRDGSPHQILCAIRKAVGSKNAEERAMESLHQLADVVSARTSRRPRRRLSKGGDESPPS